MTLTANSSTTLSYRDSRPSDWTPDWLCPPRWATPRNPERETYGNVAAKIAARIGLPLMPWQQLVLDVALEIDPATGHLAYRQVFLTLPRQGGKSSLMLVLMLARCVAHKTQQRIVYTAQSGKDAGEKFEEDYVETLRGTKGLREHTDYKVRLANGKERILWQQNRSTIRPSATTPTAGHGKTLDLAIIDEAFAHTDLRVDQSFGPPMLTRPEPQLWIVSTAGTYQSVYLNSKRAAARQSVDVGGPGDAQQACFEWSADEEDADLWDREAWWFTHPALGHTITEAALGSEIQKMLNDPDLGEAEARRAYLNITTDPPEIEVAIDQEAWVAQQDPRSSIDGRVVLGVAVSPNRGQASIAVAGRRADGGEHVELIDARAGTGWVAERLDDLTDRHDVAGVAVDPGGPSGSLVADIEDEGFEILKMSGRDYANACGTLFDRVKNRRVWHLGQPDLDDAVAGARRRPLGDAWAFDRRTTDIDITPLEAATLAMGARLRLSDEPEPDGPSVYETEGRGFFDVWD